MQHFASFRLFYKLQHLLLDPSKRFPVPSSICDLRSGRRLKSRTALLSWTNTRGRVCASEEITRAVRESAEFAYTAVGIKAIRLYNTKIYEKQHCVDLFKLIGPRSYEPLNIEVRSGFQCNSFPAPVGSHWLRTTWHISELGTLSNHQSKEDQPHLRNPGLLKQNRSNAE